MAVACLEALPSGLPEFMRNWDVVDVPKCLAKGSMGCNNLVLDDRTLVIPSEAPLDPIAQAMKERSFEVISIPIQGSLYGRRLVQMRAPAPAADLSFFGMARDGRKNAHPLRLKIRTSRRSTVDVRPRTSGQSQTR